MLHPALHTLMHVAPRSVQIALRRRRAQGIRSRSHDVWPILPDAGQMPQGWPGWPDQRRFALVLTHDVESARGMSQCRELAWIEEERGLRSAFFFVPEGRYALDASLRDELAEKGFEVGVHGLYHDWKTFSSRRVFEQRLPRIKAYLQEWGARGFRAPSTVRNLDWIGELGIDYDCSWFDTDPFEPQPQGAGTVFPFWVQSATSGRRYVELPYTLPQDHSLFVVLGERGPDLWKRKLDWIAAQGGMAMLIVHPDYTCRGSSRRAEEYPVEWYAEFLDHVVSAYGDACWHALPRDVARHVQTEGAAMPPRSRRRVAMAAYAFYDSDNRIIRYAETLASRGDTVDVFAVGRPGQPARNVVRGVNVFRIQTRRRDERGVLDYLWRMGRFLLRSSWMLSRNCLSSRYDVVHVHSVPDYEVFAAWLPKLLGAGIVLDIHDIVPEFYASKFNVPLDSGIVRFLRLLERASCRFADHVIVANHLWRDRLVSRSVPAERCSVVLNHVDQRFFATPPHPHVHVNGRFRILYAGGLQWHQGLDIAIRAFARVRGTIPGAEFLIYGDGSEKEKLAKLVETLGLQGCVRLHDPVPYDRIPSLVEDSELGVVAKRADSFGNEAYSTKILEYMSRGVPVVCSRTAIDQYYFNDRVVQFFPSGSVDDLALAIERLAHDESRRADLAAAGLDFAARNSWESRKADYLDLVDRLATTSRGDRREPR